MVYTWWVSVQNWFWCGPRWPNFSSLVAKKTDNWSKYRFATIFRKKVFTQSNSNLWCTLVGLVFRIDSLLDHVGQILALWWPQNYRNWWFVTVIWKSVLAIQFKLGMYNYLVSVKKWFALGQRWPHFSPLVANKWLKMVVSDRYLKKYSCNPIQTWCVHSWVSVQNRFAFGPCWPHFDPKVATNSLKMVVSDHYLKISSCNPIQISCVR